MTSALGVLADLPPRPEVVRSQEGIEPRSLKRPLAKLLLVEGELFGWDRSGRPVALREGSGLTGGDLLLLPAGSSLHLRFANGDRLDLAGEAWLQLRSERELLIWQGRLLLQSLPALARPKAPYRLHLPQGDLTLSVGQVGLEVSRRRLSLLVFDNGVVWQERQLIAGEQLLSTPEGERRTLLPPEAAVEWRAEVSPLVPALRQALALYERKALDRAERCLKRLQEIFPENALAAYYLGQIALEEGDLVAAVKQWRLYERLDPKGAREKGIDRHLLALLTRSIEEEIKQLLQQEAALEETRPEPNTIAVAPFSAEDRRYRRIGRALTALLVNDLAKIPGLKVVERAELERLLDELRLTAAALTDPRYSTRLGKLLRLERAVVGRFSIQQGGARRRETDLETLPESRSSIQKEGAP